MKKRKSDAPEIAVIDLLDKAMICCINIEAVAALLSCCNSQHLNPQAVANVGNLISCQARELLGKLNLAYEQST